MNTKQLKEILLKEEAKAFTGWDFSYLKGRWKDEQITWDYKQIIEQYLKDEYKLLDMGTGGGEFLLTLSHPYENTYVTESYEPNVKLCMDRLAPLGITVKEIMNFHHIPYEDEMFDLIINRHENYDISEVKRVLKPNGIFITQQIGKYNDMDLAQRLIKGLPIQFPQKDLMHASQEAKKVGFQIVRAEEEITPILFYDLGAFVYFAKIIEWEFVGFSVEKHFNELLAMQQEIDEKGYLQGSEHRYLLIMRK